MKTFNNFIAEGPSYQDARKTAPNINPDVLKRRLAKNAQRMGQNQNPGGPQKNLPGGSTAIVRTKSSGPSREATGKSVADKAARTKPSAGYMSKPDGPGKPKSQGDGDWGKPTPEWDRGGGGSQGNNKPGSNKPGSNKPENKPKNNKNDSKEKKPSLLDRYKDAKEKSRNFFKNKV